MNIPKSQIRKGGSKMSEFPTTQQGKLCLRALVNPCEFKGFESEKFRYYIFTKETQGGRAFIKKLFKQKKSVIFCAINSHTGKIFEKEIKGVTIYRNKHFIVNW